MVVLFSILFFILGVILGILLRNIITYFYKIHTKIQQAEEIIKQEQKRLEFKKKYDFEIGSNKDEDNENE